MKKALLIAFVCAAAIGQSRADTLLSQDFTTFNNGGLIGQGGWTLIGTSVVNPITVASGIVSLANNGQDAGTAFSSGVNSGDLTLNFSLSLSAAQAGGDYFLAFDTGASATNYNSRVFAKSSGSGYVLGLQMGATGATPTYGTTELAFGTIYNITLVHTFVAGALNDTGSLSVGGSSYTGLVAWSGTTSEDATLSAVAFRQGSAGSAATISSIGNLVVTGTPAAVPEPGTVALVGLGLGVVLYGARRRRALA